MLSLTINKSKGKVSFSVQSIFVLFAALMLSACSSDGGGSVPLSPGIAVSKTVLSTDEDGTEDSFEVQLKTKPSSDVKLTFTSRDTTEGLIASDSNTNWMGTSPGTDVDLDFTPADWNVPQVIRVVGQTDTILDGNQTYDVAMIWLWSLDLSYIGLTKPTLSVTNIDTSAPGVTVSKTSITTTENGASGNFSVKLNLPPTSTVTIPVTISDASEGSFNSSSSVTVKTLTFDSSNWSWAQNVYVYDVDDVIADGNQTYDITLGPTASTELAYDGLTINAVAVTNNDNDTAAFTVSAVNPLQTKEWGQTASFTVVLNTEPTVDVVIPVTSPDITEGLVSSAVVTTPAATLDLTFTAADWQTPQVVTVNPVDEADLDGDISYNISVGAPTGASEYTTLLAQTVAVVNADDDTARVIIQGADLQTTEDAGTDTFVVSLAKAPAGDVVINISSNDVTEGRVKGGNSPTTTLDAIVLTFTTFDWQTVQTVTVVGQDDFEIDDNQTYTVAVAIDAVLTLDADYDALSAQTVSVTNADNDVAGSTVAGYAYVYESGTTDFFTVKLNTMPSADVVIPLTVEDSNEFLISSGASGYVSTLNLTFTAANWSTAQTVTVQAVDDFVDENTEYYDVTLGVASSADLNYDGLPGKLEGIGISDNDTAGFVLIPSTGLVTSEDATSASFTVALTTEPVASVFVTVGSGNIAEGLLTGGNSPVTQVDVVTLEFLPGTWQSEQTVTVHGQDDLVLDGPIAYNLTVATITGTDAKYNNVNSKTVGVTNSDDEAGVSETDKVLTYAGLPYTGQVAPASTSTYSISGLAAGWKYTLTAGNVTDDIGLEVTETLNALTSLCTSTSTGAKVDESCTFTMPADGTGTVNVIINGATTENGAEFVLSMAVPSFAYTFETYGADVVTENKMYLYDSTAITDLYPSYIAYHYGYDGSAFVTYDLVAGETYYLKVMPIYTDGTGPYKIQVTDAAISLADVGLATGTEGESDGDATSASVMTLNTPLERYLAIGDIDWFAFTVPVP